MILQEELPTEYTDADPTELDERLAAVRKRLGDRIVVLGHHYQCDEIVKFADFTGDSFKLAQMACSRPDAEAIFFCGVHFMAESADILTGDDQKVILPDLAAGCSMADMANLDQCEEAWEALTDIHGPDSFIPITYMNSSAAIKAFCGRNGGVVCTSSNARAVYQWALAQEKRILFLPDQHLGRNVGYEMGIPLEEMTIWNPLTLARDNIKAGAANGKVVLWKGYCSVHARFLPEHVVKVRETIPDVQVIAHPECSFEVVQAADFSGSTERIINAIESSPDGSAWAVGTEVHLIHRLAQENPTKKVVSLSGMSCLCSTMYRIDPPHMLWALESFDRGTVVNQVTVPPETSVDARIALNQMLALT